MDNNKRVEVNQDEDHHVMVSREMLEDINVEASGS